MPGNTFYYGSYQMPKDEPMIESPQIKHKGTMAQIMLTNEILDELERNFEELEREVESRKKVVDQMKNKKMTFFEKRRLRGRSKTFTQKDNATAA